MPQGCPKWYGSVIVPASWKLVVQPSAGIVFLKPTLQFVMAVQISLFQRETLICTVSLSLNWLVLYLAGSDVGLLFPETPERMKPKSSLLVGEMRCQQLVKTMENSPRCAELKTSLKN